MASPSEDDFSRVRAHAERTLENQRKYANRPDDLTSRECTNARVVLYLMEHKLLSEAVAKEARQYTSERPVWTPALEAALDALDEHIRKGPG